jgi:hypothetical protein
MLKPRASKFRGPRTKVYYVFKTVYIGISHLCCHNILYFLNNPSVIFLTQLHSISEYCRILNTPHHRCLYWNLLNTLPSSSSREGGELGGVSLYLNPALLATKYCVERTKCNQNSACNIPHYCVILGKHTVIIVIWRSDVSNTSSPAKGYDPPTLLFRWWEAGRILGRTNWDVRKIYIFLYNNVTVLAMI